MSAVNAFLAYCRVVPLGSRGILLMLRSDIPSDGSNPGRCIVDMMDCDQNVSSYFSRKNRLVFPIDFLVQTEFCFVEKWYIRSDFGVITIQIWLDLPR